VLKRLSLHHRVIVLSTGDMGFAAKKTYDIEVWLRSERIPGDIILFRIVRLPGARMNARYRPQAGRARARAHAQRRTRGGPHAGAVLKIISRRMVRF